jgi:hypothetical protein
MRQITAGSGLCRYHSLIPTETKEARFTPARSGDPAAYRRWTGPLAPLIEIFGYLDARSFLETGRAAVFLRD